MMINKLTASIQQNSSEQFSGYLG